MKQSIRLGRVAGIPIGMHWSVLVIVGVTAYILARNVLPTIIPHLSAGLYWSVAAAGTLLFGLALGAHELAHALVAIRSGVKVHKLTFWMLGGIAELSGQPPTARADLRIAVAGPATSFAAAVIFGGGAFLGLAAHAPTVLFAALMWLALMNVVLAVFNLLPGAPLDGGRILRGLMWRRYGDRQRASRAAERAGQAMGAVLALLGVAELLTWRNLGGLWLMLIGWFLVTMARSEQQTDEIQSSLAGLQVRDVMRREPDFGAAADFVTDFTTRVVFSSQQAAFPVLGLDGDIVGVIFADTLAHVPAADRATTRLGQIAIPVPSAYLIQQDAPADSLVSRPPLRGELLAMAVADDAVTGLITTEELRLAMLRATLVASTPHADAPIADTLSLVGR